MDIVKIGKFIKEQRTRLGLTQEQLGEKLGVTNKTVSRWETGTYLPPVEMLQFLSGLYGVTINEILCGEILSDEEYKKKADENVLTALDGSVFSMKEKRKFYWREWMKKYAWVLALYIIAVIGLGVCGIVSDLNELIMVEVAVCFAGTSMINERRTVYVERKVYEDKLSQLQMQNIAE